jgi:hypothetical protein
MHGESHARSKLEHDEHHHVERTQPEDREEIDKQLVEEQVGRERTAHEEPSSQTKMKKNMMQRANSAASLVGSMRDTAREREGDNAVKPIQRKERTKLPDDGSIRPTSTNDVVCRNDAQEKENLINRQGKTVEAGKQGRLPDDSLHGPQELLAGRHLKVQGVGMVKDDKLRHQNPKKGDVRHVDTHHVEGSRSAALPIGRGRGGEVLRKWSVH